MSLNIEKMEKYLTGLAKHNATKEANLKVLDEELQQQSMCLEISFITSCAVVSALFVYFLYIAVFTFYIAFYVLMCR